MGSPRHVIVWDLDGTVGNFDALRGLSLHAPTHDPLDLHVRPHLAETLQLLIEQGFTHTVLTLATPLYAELALRATGLRDFFSRVEGVGQRGKGDSRGLAGALGISEKEQPHRLFFVGDHPLFDPPQDPRVLFHYEPAALTRSAHELATLVLGLRDVGKGSLRKGFDAWLRDRKWWQWRPSRSKKSPIQRTIPGVGNLIFVERDEECPVIAFAEAPREPATASVHTVIPCEHLG